MRAWIEVGGVPADTNASVDGAQKVRGAGIGRYFSGSSRYWICQGVGWGGSWLIGVAGSLSESSFRPVSLVENSVFSLTLFGGSVLLRAWILRKGWLHEGWRELLPRLIFAVALVATSQIACYVAFLQWAGSPEWHDPRTFWFAALMMFFISGMTLLSWTGIYFGAHLQQRLVEMQLNQIRSEAALREARHRTLCAQVNPHFLFNSLNTIRALIDENPVRARQAVTELARMFRASLDTSTERVIPLRRELELVEAWLWIERARYEERLRVTSDIQEEALELRVPPFLLQNLVENAVKYGVSQSVSGGDIFYAARLSATGLELVVTNPGRIAPENGSTRVGLENSRQRLQMLFGPGASLRLEGRENGTVTAEVLIPQTGEAHERIDC